MSFILDALRRAQSANEHSAADSAPIYADRVPEAPADLRRQVLIVAAGLSTLCAVALLAWYFGRESAAPRVAPSVPVASERAAPAAPRTTPTPTLERAPVRALDQEAARGRPAPAPSPTPTAERANKTTPGSVTVMPAFGSTQTETPTRPPAQAPTTSAERAALPQYENLLADGKINLPNLQMDMHVYNRQSTKRFVFINFKKYREGDALDRNTTIEEITTRGAVLNYNGERFLLQPN